MSDEKKIESELRSGGYKVTHREVFDPRDGYSTVFSRGEMVVVVDYEDSN